MMKIAKELNGSRIVVKQKLTHLELKEEGRVKTVPSSSFHLVLPDELSFTSLITCLLDKTLPLFAFPQTIRDCAVAYCILGICVVVE